MESFFNWLESRAADAADDIMKRHNMTSSLRLRSQEPDFNAWSRRLAGTDTPLDMSDTSLEPEQYPTAILNRPLYKQKKPEEEISAAPLSVHPDMIAMDKWSRERALPPPEEEIRKIKTPKGPRSNVYTWAKNPKLKGDPITPEVEFEVKRLGDEGHTPLGIALMMADKGHRLNIRDIKSLL